MSERLCFIAGCVSNIESERLRTSTLINPQLTGCTSYRHLWPHCLLLSVCVLQTSVEYAEWATQFDELPGPLSAEEKADFLKTLHGA